MTELELKNKLLDTNAFIDNYWLDLYCTLIVYNLSTKKEKYKTQSHHIIPIAYYKMKYNCETRQDALIISNK